MEENQKFSVQIETGEIKEAELLTVVEIDGKQYAIYMIDNDDYGNDNVDILASYVEKDEEGYDKLVDIDDPEDRAKVAEFIKNLIS
jgi:hypothetical protein